MRDMERKSACNAIWFSNLADISANSELWWSVETVTCMWECRDRNYITEQRKNALQWGESAIWKAGSNLGAYMKKRRLKILETGLHGKDAKHSRRAFHRLQSRNWEKAQSIVVVQRRPIELIRERENSEWRRRIQIFSLPSEKMQRGWRLQVRGIPAPSPQVLSNVSTLRE